MEIVIGGLGGTGKGEAAKLIGSKLNLEVISTGHFFRGIAQKRGVAVEQLAELIKYDPSIDRQIDEQTREFGRINVHYVLDGRLAALLIPKAVKFLFTASDETRYMRVARRDGCSLSEADKNCKFREAADDERFLKLYGIKNACDKVHYDFCIDTTTIPVQQVAVRVINLARYKKQRTLLRR